MRVFGDQFLKTENQFLLSIFSKNWCVWSQVSTNYVVIYIINFKL
jgi:hypothetical protein